MANFKKEDKAWMIATIKELEKRVGALESPKVFGGVSSVAPETIALLESALVQAPSPILSAEVKRKCQTSNCISVETKEYQGSGMKMWLCETHKL